MPVPDYQSLMLPALKAFDDGDGDGVELTNSEVRERIAAAEGLSDEDVQKRFPSGRQTVFGNRVNTAVKHLERAGLLERVHYGMYRLTERGERLLSRDLSRIDMNLLREEYPDYAQWSRRANAAASGEAATRSADVAETPEEALDRAVWQLSSDLEADVLRRVRDAAPAFLERVVVDLLIAMGYGGGDAAMGRVTGGPGDRGFDATIREDALGLDEVHVQAKRYAEGSNVGGPDLRSFAGALDSKRMAKGVFVTTAGFTSEAKRVVTTSTKRIVLIDGEELARLMVRHGVGVRTRLHHEIKRIDEDYFEPEAE